MRGRQDHASQQETTVGVSPQRVAALPVAGAAALEVDAPHIVGPGAASLGRQSAGAGGGGPSAAPLGRAAHPARLREPAQRDNRANAGARTTVNAARALHKARRASLAIATEPPRLTADPVVLAATIGNSPRRHSAINDNFSSIAAVSFHGIDLLPP